MNSRIKEITKQVDKWFEQDGHSYSSSAWNEKFAELIVKECAHIAWLNSTEDNVSHTKIKENFGVKE